MKAMILAAGLGTRLGALTASTPKCLIEAGGKTMLLHAIERLQSAGVKEIIINTHYLAAQIEEYVRQNSKLGVSIEISFEPRILGTGGGLKKVESFFKNEKVFFLYNADVFSDIDLTRLLHAQREGKTLATLMIMRRSEKSYLLFDPTLHLIGWEKPGGEKVWVRTGAPDATRLAFCGIQVLSPRIFDYMSDQPEEFSIISTYLKAAECEEKVLGLVSEKDYWIDMGSPEGLKQLREKLEKA